jgi:hypothetical protein
VKTIEDKKNRGGMRLHLRLLLDLALAFLLLSAYAYRITGDTAHEWIGVSVFVLFVIHNILNRKWYKNIFLGKYNGRRIIMTTINLLLAFAMVTLIITGLLHSRTVLAFLRLPGGMLIRLIHTTAAYWGIILIAVHIGLHWGMIMNVFRRMLNIREENRIRKIAMRIVALAVVVCGVWSSFDRDIFSKLFLGFSFDYWPEERPAILFFAAILSIMGMYIYITYYALKIFDWLYRRSNTGG